MSDIPVCIDISHYQGYPDFDEVRAAGVLGMIHKATEGTSYIDPARAENCANAKAAGLAIATYFWLKPGDGRSQAEFYLQLIEPVPGERVIIDYEEDGCSLATLKDAVQGLLDCGNDLQITVYGGNLLKEALGDDCDDFLAANTDLWLAQYNSESNISWPEGTYPKWSLWQYSEDGEIPGINDSYVDLNQFCKDEAAFLKWISPKGSEPEPPRPTPETELVEVAVTAPANVNVRVSVNGVIARRRWGRRRVKRGPDIVR